jgi:transposase-like protein
MTKPDLKPCPFCGSSNLKTGGDDKFVGVWCNDCQATGPNHYGRSEWNTRAKPTIPWTQDQFASA